MKILNFNKRTVFAFGLIIGAVLLIIFTFAVPGMRTYVGVQEEMDISQIAELREEEEEPIEYIAKETRITEDMEKFAEEKPSEVYPEMESYSDAGKLTKEESAIVYPEKKFPKKLSSEEMLRMVNPMSGSETKEVAEGKSQESVSEGGVPIIPHDHIPVKWEYKMKE